MAAAWKAWSSTEQIAVSDAIWQHARQNSGDFSPQTAFQRVAVPGTAKTEGNAAYFGRFSVGFTHYSKQQWKEFKELALP